MTTSASDTVSGILHGNALRNLARQRGPCVTLVVPAHHPGAQEGSRRALVHSLIRMANERLSHCEFAGARDLVIGLEEIERESGIDEGGAGFAIFRSPEQKARYYLPDQPSERLVIAARFCLLPFVADGFAPHDFFVLVISRKHLRLFHFINGICEELPLPARVPANLDTAGGFDQPDHDLVNRSSAGPSIGAMRGVQFGTLSDREALPSHVHHFFAMVDRELKVAICGKPLLLLGTQEDVTAYRRTAKHIELLEPDCIGSAEFLSIPEIAVKARNAARLAYTRQAERALAEYLEMPDRSRTLVDVPAIVRAAEQGRVHRLCIRSESESTGPGDDLVNAAVVETLSTGGEVFMLPHNRMPVPMTAILRY